MEAVRPRSGQGKKKTKKSKYRNSDGKVQECSYETLPQEVESLQVSDIEESCCSHTTEDKENLIGENAESVRLLEAEGKEYLEDDRDLPSQPFSSGHNVLETNYLKSIKDSQDRTLDTELNEIHSAVLQLSKDQTSNQADTTFESPLHLPSSPSVESAEDPLTLWDEADVAIAQEVGPTAPPVLQDAFRAVSEISEQTIGDKPFYPFLDTKLEAEQLIKPFTLPQLAALYHNQELDAAEEFVAQFVESELRGGDVLRHPLYELLVNYQRARAKISVNHMELNALKQECKVHQSHLWLLEKAIITERGECQDGNPVEASHEFQTAHYNKSSAANLQRCLRNIRAHAESFALNAYTCQVNKLQVDDYIQKLEAEFSFLPHNAPVNLVPEALPSFSSQTGQDLRQVILELRRSISVLFSFQRRPLRDEDFVADTRTWLSRLVAVLLRVATWREHLFLLQQALRCPAGVGRWASCYIQPPPAPPHSPFSGQHLDHLVTCLACVLLPVQARDLFLSQMVVSTDNAIVGSDAEAAWFLVDSDGEDEADTNSLRESDIVAFLNQVPFDAIFRQMLHITQRDERNVYNGQLVTDHHVLRLVAFCSLVVGLLEQGLRSHTAERYRQYTKRLGRLVRHTMQYVTDQWLLFRGDRLGRDPAMLARLAVEYDALLTRAVTTLYSSPGRHTWQFLAVLPFGAATTPTLWALFRFLLLGDDEPVDESRWSLRLEEHLSGLSDAEIYYLLTAVNTMALSRPIDDWQFIRATTLQLLEIGFLNLTTRESCYKSARIMLANLSLKYPGLISDIIEQLKNSSNCGKLCLLLMKELPLSQWHPTEADLATLELWLLDTSITTVKNALARYIVSGLNLGYATDDLSHELFLPRWVHVRLAMVVLKAAVLYCPQSPPEGHTISETVKQMASLSSLMTRPSSSEQAITVWGWQTAYRLRLHLLDQSDANVRQALANPAVGFSSVPDMDSDSQEVELLSKHLKTHQAMAIYMRLQLTALGHTVPLVCTRGLALLSVLQSCQLYTAVISLLQHLVPLFLDCPSTLVQSDKFRTTVLSLLSADRTFLRAAKSLISPDLPGHILQQFGDMIHYHLDNYSQYNLMSSTPLAQLWLQSLCVVYNEEPTGAAYLMDVVLSCAFFRSDVTAMAYDNLSQLLQTLISSSQANSRLSSLFSWMSGGGVATLVPQAGSCPHAPWFAYFALHVEEVHTQGTNGLWREVVKELALTPGKPSVDNAVKRAAATLKLATIPSSALSLYRWSQQALDTSVDHPALPLLWQRFFILYFTRLVSPTGEDHGSVGYKLFEGLTYQTYQKRLKRKLSDCVEYFRTKASVGDPSPEKLLLYDTLSKLYETFSLWLDEPRLHEPGLYLPALPPQYNPYKLSAITSAAEQSPWFEYVDYECVRASQNASVERWRRTQGRNCLASTSHPPTTTQEDPDPIQRIDKRLRSYDSPVPPPALRPRLAQPVVPPITRQALLHKDNMLEALSPSFKSILEFAQSYCLRMSEHTALDCSLLELLPTLYTHIETEVTLYAACDTAEPRSRPPAANALNCAGPAVIYIKVCPAAVSEGVRRQVETNRSEMDGLLQRSLQAPPSATCVASVHLELAVKSLEKECSELKNIGDVQLLSSVSDVGMALFYHMCSLYTDEVVTYPPLKQLFTTCIETLGNMFISGIESQCVRLLTSVMQRPQLSGIMCPHFTPSVATPTTFLQMYSTLVGTGTTPSDLLFVLLSKFDIGQWLVERKPRLVERTQIIEMTGKALATAGLSPSQEQGTLMLHGVFRHHLVSLFLYDFPQHYGEILAMLLRHSEAQCLAPDTWFDLINALACTQCRPALSLGQLKEMINKYATEQRALSLQELRETTSMFGSHFTKERLHYGLYGLYPKYRAYVEALTIFQGMIGHALVVATLHNDRGSLSDKLCDQLWPHVSGLFSPWLAPYFTQHLSEPTAAWIQQLTDDRSVLPPWIVADGGYAHKMASMFVECVRFIIDTLPGASSNVLSCVWQFYVTNYAHSSIKDHILSVMHGNLISLPWQRFFPCVQDVDLMLKVVDQYLPDCHTFLGAVFIEVPWAQWVNTVTASSQAASTAAHVHAALLHLLIKLANEPNVRQSPKVTPLLLESQLFSWHLVDCASYESVTNWFVMSYDPRVVLQLTGESWSNTDMAALDLLEMAAGFSTKASQFHSSTPRKRQMFVRACVKLMLSTVSRHKQLLSTSADEIKACVRRLIDKIETVITATVAGSQRVSEAGLLLTEVLALVNQPAQSPVTGLAQGALLAWLDTRSAASVVVASLLRVLGLTVAHCDTLGALLEASLTAFFRRSGVSESCQISWSMAVHALQPIVPRHPPLEDTLVTDGHLLSLYALTLKHMPASLDVRDEAGLLNNLNQWLAAVKVSDWMEAKLPLLWSQALYLCVRQCEYSSEPSAGPLTLRRLVQSVTQAGDHRAGAGWGILGAIGIVKNQAASNRCRLLGRFLVALVLAQMPNCNNNAGQSTGSSQFVRIKPHAPGSLTSSNGDYSASAEALKALSTLESLVADKNYRDLQTTAECAVKLVRQPENSLHNAHQLVMDIARQLYTESFLHAHRLTDRLTA